MKIIAISDLHGYLPTIEDQADIMLIAGDISPLDIQGTKVLMKEWIIEEFIPWINKLKVEKVFLVAGNHDRIFETVSEADILEWKMLTSQKLQYLKNELTTYIDNNGISWTIFGTPYCHIFGRWSFMISDEGLEEKFKEIPKGIDILLTHDAPYGCSDICYQNYSKGHIGNVPLRDIILEKSPKYVFHGHLHSSNHEFEILGKSKVVNVSLLDEYYNPIYKPFIIELEKWENT